MSEFFLLNVVLLLLLMATALGVFVLHNLFASTMVLSLYSLLMAVMWSNLDAADVALTEAAVGAGIATVLLIGALVVVGPEQKRHPRIRWPGLLLVAATMGALFYGSFDIPRFGDPGAPAQAHVAPQYIAQSVPKLGGENQVAVVNGRPSSDFDNFHGHVPNLVTSVIVNYRAYDTLLEVAVIFTAGVSLVLLVGQRR
ncbi:MAG TPA: hydrogenase subunit MbhD domain-containing protein [Candidatus Acidoferrales bacterium]|nr:hydrogenase subunit MbhD domain-containing protein [Candidatus Acidoferrales bacterium]